MSLNDEGPRWCPYVVVAAPPAVSAPGDLEALVPAADWIELRIDLLAPAYGASPEQTACDFVEAATRPCLVTVRSAAEGGAFDGPVDEVVSCLRAALAVGAAAIDAEPAVLAALGDVAEAHLIVSTHTREGLGSTASRGLRKRALRTETAEDLAALLHAADLPGFGVPYGALAGLRTALACGQHGGLLFGAAAASAVVAGQPELTVLLDELRAGEVTPQATRFALLGRPPAHSPSPAMHNAWFRATRRDALYVAAPLGVGEVVAARGALVLGASVTMPFKQEAHASADVLGPFAARSGSVNTLLWRGGQWHGFDTDTAGIVEHLELPASEGRAALVYGAGGYARALAVALHALGWRVHVTARRLDEARRLADDLGVDVAESARLSDGSMALVANATPAGAGVPLPPLLATIPLAGRIVLDAPYVQEGKATALVLRAKGEGAARVVEGRALLLAQAMGQAAVFAETAPDPSHLREVLHHALHPPASLVLLGLRGAGKTSVGRAVARRLGRPFVDLDAEVQRLTGAEAGALIRAQGIDAFRRVESRVLRSALGRTGVVIATGGGVVEAVENREALEASRTHTGRDASAASHLVWLDVAPTVSAQRIAASSMDRPRLTEEASLRDEAVQLHARRRPLGVALADTVISAEDPLDAVEDAVIRAWIGTRATRVS